MPAARLAGDADLVGADLEVARAGLQPAYRVVDVDQSIGISVGSVAEVQRGDDEPAFRQGLVEALGTGQIAAVPSAAMEVDHGRKRAIALWLVEPCDQRLVAVAQILDIFGREFVIRHVTPFPGCAHGTGFGDWAPTAAEFPKLTVSLLAPGELRKTRRRWPRLTHISRVSERVTARLRPDRQAVRLLPDRDGFDGTGGRIDVVNDIVKAPRKPQLLSVRRYISHVGAASARDRQGSFDFVGREVDHRDAALAVRRPVDLVGAAVGDIELGRIAARVKAVRPDPCRNEISLSEALAVDQIDAVGMHVGNVEGRAVWRDPNVLGHASLGELQITEHLVTDEVDLDEATTAKFAGKDRVASVDREIGVVDPGAARGGNGLLQRHRMRVAKVEAFASLGDNDRRSTIGSKIEVVGVVDRDGLPG